MNRWFVRAPWWQLAPALGMPLAAIRLVISRLQDESWAETAVDVVGALLLGLVLGSVLAWQNRRARGALGTDDPRTIRRASRDARWGTVPDDPVRRERARRMALVIHDQAVRSRPWVLAAGTLCLVLAVVAGVVTSSVVLLLVLAVPFAVLLVVHVWMTRRFARRAELLRDPSAQDSGRDGMLPP